MAEYLTAPPVLSTSETHILTGGRPETVVPEPMSDESFKARYEISRTIDEIRQRKWRKVALQFPDQMLSHSARVYQLLARGLRDEAKKPPASTQRGAVDSSSSLVDDGLSELSVEAAKPIKLTILGDTSYGSCCVDEIAAEHVDADAVVHYGRACLSPTTRLPVLHIYTTMDLDLDNVVQSFQTAFPDLTSKVVLTADVPHNAHVRPLFQGLQQLGYFMLYAASIVHDPSSAIPNRTVPISVSADAATLSEWSLFHISEPPTSLLLTLHSRMASIRIYSTSNTGNSTTSSSSLEKSTSLLLRRRYALITSLTVVPVWGILINTLSVKNYLTILSHIKSLISGAGKKSYLFVVGKLNPAKLANFSEIGGWVVIGCWESSLVDSRDFYKPIITPFELEMVLMGDESRVWTGEWRADFQRVLEDADKREEERQAGAADSVAANDQLDLTHDGEIDTDTESEDEPPEFDLRTGRYVSRTRPMRRNHPSVQAQPGPTSGSSLLPSTALTKKTNGTMISINGIASPAAEYLAQKRSWRGLGSDFEVKYEEDEAQIGDVVEEGRTGVASGYTIGEDDLRT